MFYTIQLRSSNKKSLKKYANLFEKFLLLNKHTIKLVSLKQLPKSLHKKTFSFIRSPHVNSVSGEHFKYTIYTLNIRIYCYNYKQFNFFCKKKAPILAIFGHGVPNWARSRPTTH